MDNILKSFKKYFKIQELVDEAVYNKWGEMSWQFIDSKLMESLLVIREGLNLPMYINDWSYGGKFDERGLRHNLSDMVINKTQPYLSAHMMGKAVDFDVKGMTAEDVRDWICDNEELFPHKIRLEHKKNGKPINWVHLDVFDYSKNPHIYKFNI